MGWILNLNPDTVLELVFKWAIVIIAILWIAGWVRSTFLDTFRDD